MLVWVGGNKKVDGRTPTAEAVADRISLIRRTIDTLFAAAEFDTCWTYIKPGSVDCPELLLSNWLHGFARADQSVYDIRDN